MIDALCWGRVDDTRRIIRHLLYEHMDGGGSVFAFEGNSDFFFGLWLMACREFL